MGHPHEWASNKFLEGTSRIPWMEISVVFTFSPFIHCLVSDGRVLVFWFGD